jgi:HSP20 family protein
MASPVRRQRTAPTRWDPLYEIERIFSQLGAAEGSGDVANLSDGFSPIADVEEADDSYVIDLELPGVKKDDVEISVAGRRVIISGQRKEKERVGVMRRRERLVGSFRFEIELPTELDEQSVTASLDDGVLNVRIPKRNDDRARRIQVS